MDELFELAGREVVSQFRVDRFSARTLALVYQRLTAQTDTQEDEDDSFRNGCAIENPGSLSVEVVS